MTPTRLLALPAALALGLTALPALAQTTPSSCPSGQPLANGTCAPTTVEQKGSNDYERVWHKGDHIGGFAYHIIVEYHRYGLPTPPKGQFYVALGDQVMLVDRHSLNVTRLIGMTNKILG